MLIMTTPSLGSHRNVYSQFLHIVWTRVARAGATSLGIECGRRGRISEGGAAEAVEDANAGDFAMLKMVRLE